MSKTTTLPSSSSSFFARISFSLLHRLHDTAFIWFMTVNPMQDLLTSTLQADSIAYGLVPSPYYIIHSTMGKLAARTIGCFITAFFAPERFPFPWSHRAETFDSNGLPNFPASASFLGKSTSFAHHYRYLSTLFHFTNDNLAQFMFSRLWTTRIANFVSDWISDTFFKKIRRVFRRAMIQVDQYFGVDHLPASLYEQITPSSSSSKMGSNMSGEITLEDIEKLENDEKLAEEEFNKHVFEKLGQVCQVEGPVKMVLYRNTIPFLTYFAQNQALWIVMAGMSKSRRMRKLLVGRFFTRNSVIPFSQLWKMWSAETLVNLTEIGMSLFFRSVGALIGYHIAKLVVPRSSFVASYMTVSDGALFGEQLLGNILTKGFRGYASFYVHHKIGEFLVDRFPTDEETVRREIEELSDLFEDEMNGNQEQDEEEGDYVQDGTNEDGTPKFLPREKKSKHIGDEEFDHVLRQAVYTKENYYAHLGVEKTATQEEIRKAYRKQAILCHPDRLASASREEQAEGAARFKKIQQSYEILSNEKRRKEYDVAQEAGMDEPPEFAAQKQQQNQHGKGRRRRHGPPRGPPPNPFTTFFGSSKNKKSSSSSSGRRPDGTLDEDYEDDEHNVFGEKEEEEDENEQSSPEEHYEYFEQQQHGPIIGMHPAVVVSKYFNFVDNLCGHDNVGAQKVVYGVSSLGAFSAMFVVMHQHAANSYTEFLKPGV